jgi:hypothetical protein
MYFAKLYPARTKRVVTLDNLRVPFVTNGRFKILSFRSKDPIFKTDPGVIPPEDVCKKAGIDIIPTGFRHNDMRDTGPDQARESIQGVLDNFVEDETPLKSVEPRAPQPDLTDVGPDGHHYRVALGWVMVISEMQIYAVRYHVDNVVLVPFAAATKHFPDLVAFNGFHRKLPMFCVHRLLFRPGNSLTKSREFLENGVSSSGPATLFATRHSPGPGAFG